MGIFDRMSEHGFEQLVFGHDRATGLRAIIAIHNTTLGPGLGGTRMYPYRSEDDAIADALRLSRAMTYKSAAAGLNLGGGKAVIIGDPSRDKSEALLRAYGRLIHTLGGRYWTASDVGTNSKDMDIVRQETPYVTACSEENGGGGDTSVLTGLTVYMGMKACAREVFGTDSLAGRKIVLQGVGKVGTYLLDHLVKEEPRLAVTDIDAHRARSVAEKYKAELIDSLSVYDVECDIFSPNALGGVLNEATIPRLKCRVVVGGANNQLATAADAERLQKRGILYAPDYIVNSGGVINAGDELLGYNRARATAKAQEVYYTTLRVFAMAKTQGITTAEAADRLAEERIRVIGEVHRTYLPR